VVAAGGGEQDVQVDLRRGVDDAGDEVELHVRQTLAGRRDHQPDGARAALGQGAGGRVGDVAQFVDDVLDAFAGHR
jgi:hypothetical protein